mgnify:CR=1 FL=1
MYWRIVNNVDEIHFVEEDTKKDAQEYYCDMVDPQGIDDCNMMIVSCQTITLQEMLAEEADSTIWCEVPEPAPEPQDIWGSLIIFVLLALAFFKWGETGGIAYYCCIYVAQLLEIV